MSEPRYTYHWLYDDFVIYDGDIPLSDEEVCSRLNSAVFTPADIAAAHLKCGTCDYYGLNHPDGWNECINEDSPYFERHDGMIDRDVDYCRFHSELTKPHTPQEEQR